MNQQTDKYIKYLNKIAIINSLRKQDFMSEQEAISLKRYIQNKYKIRDYN